MALPQGDASQGVSVNIKAYEMNVHNTIEKHQIDIQNFLYIIQVHLQSDYNSEYLSFSEYCSHYS